MKPTVTDLLAIALAGCATQATGTSAQGRAAVRRPVLNHHHLNCSHMTTFKTVALAAVLASIVGCATGVQENAAMPDANGSFGVLMSDQNKIGDAGYGHHKAYFGGVMAESLLAPWVTSTNEGQP